jgi:hypothetical protein
LEEAAEPVAGAQVEATVAAAAWLTAPDLSPREAGWAVAAAMRAESAARAVAA